MITVIFPQYVTYRQHLLSVQFLLIITCVRIHFVEIVKVDGIWRYVVHLNAGRMLEMSQVLVNELSQCVQVLT